MAVIIGKAAIKIFPDTKRFREETLAKLKSELKGLDKNLRDEQRVHVPVEVEVDERRSARNIQRFVDKIQNQTLTVKVDVDIDRKFEHLDNYLNDLQDRAKKTTVKVEADLDTDSFEREFGEMLRETDRMSRTASEHVRKIEETFGGVADSAGRARKDSSDFFDEFERDWQSTMDNRDLFRYVWDDFAERADYNFEVVKRRFKNLMQSIRESGPGDDLEMDVDMSTLEGNLQVIRSRLQEIKDDFDDTDLEFHPVLDETSYRGVWARIKWLTRDRIAMIHPVVNRGAAALAERTLKAITLNATGLRNAGRALRNFFEYLERLDKNAPVLGLIATGIAAISGAALAAVGTVSTLAVEFTRMAGAGLALPGILGGFAVGIGVMVAALQDFNREVPKVREDLGRMQDMISDRFWQQARVPLLDAWNRLLPSLESGFNKTATALGNWTAAMATGLADNLRPESMAYMFDNLAESIDIAALSADDVGRSLEILGKRGSEYLPRLAAWTNELASGFRDWLDEADRTGELNRMIETGIDRLQEFGKLVRESGELVYILGSAAERAGFSGLKEMADGLEDVNESLKRNQDNLDDYFSGSARMADGFKDALGSIMDGLGDFSGTFDHISGDVESVMEDIGDALEEVLGNERFQQGVEDLFGGISSAVEDLSDVAPDLAEVLGSIGSLAGTVIENIGDVGSTIVENFGPEIVQVLEDVEQPLDDLGDAIEDLINALSGGDEEYSILSALGTLTSWATSNVLNEATEKIDALADAIEGLKRVFSGDWGGLSQAGDGISEILLGPLATLNRKMGEWFGYEGFWTFDDWFGSAGTAIWEWIKEQVAEIGRAFEWLGEQVSTAAGAAVDWIVDLFSGDGEGGSGVANIGMAIVDWFDFSEIIPEIQEKWEQLKTGVQTAWDNFWAWLTGIFENPDSGEFDFFGTIQRWLGLEDVTFEGLFDAAKETLQNAWDGFWEWVGSLFGGDGGDEGSGGFDVDFNLNAIDNATEIVSNVGATIRDWAVEKYEAVLDALDSTGDTIATAKGNLVAWATDKYEAVLTALSRVQTGITAAKTAITTWARGKYEAALTALNNTGTGISNAVSSIRTRVVNATFQAKVTMSSVVSGLGTVVSRIRNAVSNFTANVTTRFNNAFANGGVTNGQGVQVFAQGGITNGIASGLDKRVRYATEHHVAQIAPAGAMRLWAEPETGGEAYIPLSSAKRERSTAILSDVADRFGYKLQKFNNGSEPSGNSYGGNNYTVNVQTLRPDVASEVTGDVMFHLKHLAYGGGRQHGN